MSNLMVGRLSSLGSSVVKSSTRPYLRLSLIVPTISYSSLAIILVSTVSSCFTLAVFMHEVFCVGYTLCARDPRSLLSMLNGLLYFGLLERFCIDNTALDPLYNYNDINPCSPY